MFGENFAFPHKNNSVVADVPGRRGLERSVVLWRQSIVRGDGMNVLPDLWLRE